MRKHYGIVFPAVAGMPIMLVDYYQGGKHRYITLGEAKDAVFKAVLQGHTIMIDPEPGPPHPLIAENLVIIDKSEFERSREQWIAANATANLKEAMNKDAEK